MKELVFIFEGGYLKVKVRLIERIRVEKSCSDNRSMIERERGREVVDVLFKAQ